MRLMCGVLVSLAIAAGFSAEASAAASIGEYGFDSGGMNRTVKPGDDFNAYANGSWIAATKIPEDRPSWGVWDVLEEQSYTHVREILEAAGRAHAAVDSNTQKIGDFYSSFMDEAGIEKRGAEPLRQQLDAVRAINSYAALATAMGNAIRVDDSMPIALFIIPDFKDPNVYAAYIDQNGLGLPDRDYYLQNDDDMKAARAAYTAYVTKLFLLSKLAANEADAAKRTKAVFDLEHRLAEVQWSRVQQRDLAARYRPWKRAEYATRAPGFDWNAFFKASGLDSQSMLVASVDSAITGTAAIVPTVPLPVWRDYMSIRAIDRHAPFLSKAFVDAHFAFHRTALEGTPAQQERWKRGVRYTERAMGEAVGQPYVEKHFGPDAKAAARQLVSNLLTAASSRVERLDWMSAETKARAREKLAAFGVKIGYPDKWRDYSKLHIAAGQAYRNALAGDRFEYERNLAKLGTPVDRTEWQMTPMAINAYYDPTMNEIVFPAAVLQPPFFDPKADAAVNYGGIGAIIGHEISHGFDDQGRLFDARGAMKDWWTGTDAARYKERTTALVAQYAAYEVLPNLRLNGELTLGENIADNAGLVIAYDAYHVSLDGKPAPVVDGTSGDQRFFLGYAQNWRTLWREQNLRQIVTTDPHSPDALRVRAVRNFDPWYSAFDVKPGEALGLPAQQRVRIW